MRRLLLWMASNTWMRRNIPKLWFAKRAVRKFMPGESAEDALKAAEKFRDESGIATLFTRLGENVTRAEQHEEAADHYNWLIEEIHRRGIKGEASVKLTHLAMDMSDADMQRHTNRLCETAAASGQIVWIDMEGSDYTDKTLAEYSRLKAKYPNVGVCLQAYLHRTAADVEALLPLGPKIRLVKGAYKESPAVAWQKRPDVDASYLSLCVAMLTHLKDGRDIFLGMGTHDVALIEKVAAAAESMGLSRGAFDIEMLYGIRADQQRRLKGEGYNVRVLIAYGDYWFPWYMRRMAERPANVVFALRQMLPW
ncbi:MAG: proline dehydrogenase [Chloroflexota bacterium]|nr:proline dehydrogenase [Chloroflexota bacterium]